jgi:hypothetical protein
MSAYINLDTLEYPRFEGDIALDPDGAYAPVAWVDPPEVSDTRFCFELAPELTGSGWEMRWGVKDMTPEQLEVAKDPSRFLPHNISLNQSGSAPDVAG